MNFGSMFGKVATTWQQFIDESGATWAGEWVGKLLNTLSQVMWVALALVGAAGAVYAIYVGVKMARSESAEQREENKKRFINIIVSIIVVIVLILIFNVVVPMILSATVKKAEDGETSTTAVRTLVATARTFLHV